MYRERTKLKLQLRPLSLGRLSGAVCPYAPYLSVLGDGGADVQRPWTAAPLRGSAAGIRQATATSLSAGAWGGSRGTNAPDGHIGWAWARPKSPAPAPTPQAPLSKGRTRRSRHPAPRYENDV